MKNIRQKMGTRTAWADAGFRAFTLIELLVVVTIIVVLLALLTPALDRAVYQAELAVCAAQQRGIVSGIGLYAMSNKRQYPARPTPTSYWSRDLISYDAADRAKGSDLRPIIRDFTPMKMHNDPFLTPQDLDAPVRLDPLLQVIYSSYELWFGESLIAKMPRVGSRYSFGVDSDGDAQNDATMHSTALVKDYFLTSGASFASSSHSDAGGFMAETTADMENPDPPHHGRSEYAHYVQSGTVLERIVMDLNVGFADESVIRYGGAAYDPNTRTVVGTGGARLYPVSVLYLPAR